MKLIVPSAPPACQSALLDLECNSIAVAETKTATAAQESEARAPLNSSMRIPELDGLRGVAFFFVLVYHYVALIKVGPGTWEELFWRLGRMGWASMDSFFVLSGFLIGGILLDARTSPKYFKVFYIRRVCRIFPLYWVLLLIFFAGMIVASYVNQPQMDQLFKTNIPWYSYATFTQNFWMAYYGHFGALFFAVTWSLAVEEQFYLTLPWLIRFVREKLLVIFLVCVVLAAPVLRVFFYWNGARNGIAMYALMPCRADSFALGVLAAYFLRQPAVFSFLAARKRLLLGSLAVFWLSIVLLALGDFRHTSKSMATLGYTWIALFYLNLLVVVVTQKETVVNRVLCHPALMKVGQMSYGLYLMHLIIFVVCKSLFLNIAMNATLSVILSTLLALVLTFVMAHISWTYLEKPFIKRGLAYSYDRSTAALKHEQTPFAMPVEQRLSF